MFFTYPIKAMKEDVFFIASSIFELEKKLKNVVKMSPATQKDYLSIEDRYPMLSKLPYHHGK